MEAPNIKAKLEETTEKMDRGHNSVVGKNWNLELEPDVD